MDLDAALLQIAWYILEPYKMNNIYWWEIKNILEQNETHPNE